MLSRPLRYRWTLLRLWWQSLWDAQLRQHRVRSQDLRWIAQATHPWQLFERCCQRYASRPCLSEPGGQGLTYGELWERVELRARQLTVAPGEPVALSGHGDVDWVVNDLALLRRGAISVPLAPGLSREERQHILAESGVQSILGEPGGEPLGPPGDEPGPAAAPLPESLFSVVYTTGSTGHPKGVMLTHQRWDLTLRDAFQFPRLPRLSLNYLPLAHMAGRINLYLTMLLGGVTTLVRPGEEDLIEAMAACEPTHMVLVPRLSGWLLERFQRVYREAGGRADSVSAMLADPRGRTLLRKHHRQWVGRRLAFVHIGSAPTADEARLFLESGLGLFVTEAYGATELGPVMLDGRVHPWLTYKLVDRPELGCTRAHRPHPRGELAIRSPRMTPGYYNNEPATRLLHDEQGFMLTGDLVEELAPRRLRWLGRCGNTQRLSQGKFVNVEHLEESFLADIPELQQLVLHADPRRDYLVALAVADCSRARLRQELGRVAARRQLAPFQVPREFLLLEQPFSPDNGLLSAAGKVRRAAVLEAFQGQLNGLYEQVERRRSLPGNDFLTVVAEVLGVDAEEIDDMASFPSLGGDSLAALQVCERVQQRLGVSLAAEAVLDPQRSIASWPTVPLTPAGWPDLADIQARVVFPSAPLRPPCTPPNCVLVTGAHGFLGRFLALELLRQLPPEAEIWALVRPGQSLETVWSSQEARQEWGQRSPGRVRLLPGNLAEPRLGLGRSEWQQLAERVQSIVHAGALVNHLLSFADLQASNLGSTEQILALAAAAGGCPVHYVSSLGILGGGNGPVGEDHSAEQLFQRRPRQGEGYAQGYLTSKWASEVLLHSAHQRWRLPLTLARCCLLLPHRSWLGEINPRDSLVRLLRSMQLSGLAPLLGAQESVPYDALPVDSVAEFLAARVVQGPPPEPILHLSARARGGPSLQEWVEAAARRWRLQRLAYDDFHRQAGERLGQLPAELARLTLLPLWSAWQRPRVGGGQVLCERFSRLYQGRPVSHQDLERMLASIEVPT